MAFRTGGVAGLLTAGLGLLGATVIIMIFQNTASSILVGFGFGGSLLALFLRVGGGIFTKAADVGADLVGKVEAGIPEDDPRNPATIADNVGDNVGDCAGMAADLFESFAVTLVASIILGVSAFRAIGLNGGHEAAKGLIFPLAVVSIGLLASMVGIFVVRGRPGETDALKAINRGIYTAQVIAIVGAAVIAFVYVGNPAGSRLSQPGRPPVRRHRRRRRARLRRQQDHRVLHVHRDQPGAGHRQGGPHRSGHHRARGHLLGPRVGGVGASSPSPWPSARPSCSAAATSASRFYLVALTGIGMLATTGIVVAEDTFGPVADNAAGIAEMAGEFEGEPERIMVSLDAVGNTTKAVTKGFAIGSAVIAAVALFASYVETIAKGTLDAAAVAAAEASGTLASLVQINVADPKTFIGLLIGGSVAFLFSSLAIRAVSRTAGTVVEEVRRQFREKPGIMDRTERPDYGAGHRHLHQRLAPRAGHPGPARGAHPGDHRLRHRLPGPRRLPRRRHRHRPAHGQLPVELGRRLGQRQEVHRGRQRGRQGLRGPQGRRHRRHRRRPVQGHRRPGPQPADQGDEPGLAAGAAGHPHPARQQRALRHRRRRPGRGARRARLLEAPGRRRHPGRRAGRRARPQRVCSPSAPEGSPAGGAPHGPPSSRPAFISTPHAGRSVERPRAAR